MSGNINELQREYDELNKVEWMNQDQQDRKNWLENKIGEYKAEIEAQAAEKEQREQGKMAIVGTYMDTLAQMFEALLPSDTFRPLFGINDYEEKRAQFYQLSQAYTGEAIETQHQQFEEIIAAKDERIKALNAQSLSVQQQLDEANKQINVMKGVQMTSDAAYDQLSSSCHQLEDENTELTKKIETLQVDAQEMQSQIGRLSAENFENKNRVAELETKLEAAQQPKEEAKPSAKVTDLIEQIKSKNDIAPDDFIARWNARQKDESVKVEVPEIKQQENQFRDEDSAAESNSDQLPSAEASTPVAQEPQFPVINPPDVNGAIYEKVQLEDSQSTSGGSSDETPVTESRLETRLAELKAEIIAEITGEKVA